MSTDYDTPALDSEIVVSEASEQDITASAQVSMDAFYGRPWKMGKSLPWIEMEASGFSGLQAQAGMLLTKYNRPADSTGKQYAGLEYVWNRKQVSARWNLCIDDSS
jgi:hypothetical protein